MSDPAEASRPPAPEPVSAPGRRRLLAGAAVGGALAWTVPAVLSSPASAAATPSSTTTTSQPPPPFAPVGVAPFGQARWMAVDAVGATRLSNSLAATSWSAASAVGAAVVDLTGTTQLGFWALLADGSVRTSTDLGATWVPLSSLPGRSDPGVAQAVAIDANALNVVVVDVAGVGAVTTDGGATWDAIQVPGLGTVVDVAWDLDGGIIAVDAAGNGQRSVDGNGFVWAATPVLGISPVAIDRAGSVYLAVALDGTPSVYDPAPPVPPVIGPVVRTDAGLAGPVADTTATGGITGKRYLVVDSFGNATVSADDGVTWSPVATIT
jgi:hypothetical protein